MTATPTDRRTPHSPDPSPDPSPNLSASMPPPAPWTVEDGAHVYGVDAWGAGLFSVNDAGHIEAVCGDGPADRIDLHAVVSGLRERGIHPPVLLRFSDILSRRLVELSDAFKTAMRENEYEGHYQPVYPIKVNQQQQVVDEVCRLGDEINCGLEVGSKPELLAVLARTSVDSDQLIICNGFKDDAYCEAVLLATKLGRRIIPVVESLREAHALIRIAKMYDVRPRLGVRVKLASKGSGRWRDSAGAKSKFGLFVSEILEMVELLRAEGLLDSLELLHCHSGSQVQDIRKVKDVVTELAHVYVGLRRAGAGLKYLDVGGGLGVDYMGQQANASSSMNYSVEEYASDVVYRIGAVCQQAGVPHPTIVTECGRAMVAHSSVLVMNVLGSTGPRSLVAGAEGIDLKDLPGEVPQPLVDLKAALDDVSERRLLECYHDAMQARDAAMTLFSLGYLSLEGRSAAERLFWAACERVLEVARRLDEMPEELEALEDQLSDIYSCNFSIFQSLPDVWAIGQLFPICPIHRLDEAPTRRAILADITCDSDGEIRRFVSPDGPARSLPVHELSPGRHYDLGVFLVGAYQETLGDLHNLFGDAHAVHIRLDEGEWAIEEIVRGDTASEVLGYMQHNPDALLSGMVRDCERAVRRGVLTANESKVLLGFYEKGLSSYTYLEPDENRGNA
ncbi:MAG: biosynthetic arginine decarboxylase [Planctomycetota bacterium]